ncbi:MAG: Fe-S cluster assembly protein SufD [Acidimicrobiales bacterium]|nr:Fe-S cluster assembly protein SufD [Acidimicrobiales bacterium]MCB9394967.1 Fe-S cluster assembly protein SufD [Acidimicrobiaceae bacterium]
MPAFTPDAVRAAAPPDLDLRLAAAERAAALAPPSPEDEVWRYSRIDELDLDWFVPGRADTTVDAPEGVHVAHGGSLDRVDDLDTIDVFHELNRAFMDAVVVSVPRGVVAERPVVVTHRVHAAGTAVFPRLIVDAAEDSELTVVEQFVSPDGLVALVVPRLEVDVAPAARLKYLGVNMLGGSTWSLAHQRALGARDSNTLLATVALGGDYARVRTEARVTGQGASTRQIALYYADDTQMHDFRTLQDHAAPRTHSDLLFKGAVQDQAKSVYTGLIKIRHDAKGSQAFQTNRNLTLSSGAWAESVPNLDIETNDVKCSHASTVGPIDEEQRFYLESRGIPPEIAERLVVLGFFDEVLEQLPVGPLAVQLREQVGAKLARRTS